MLPASSEAWIPGPSVKQVWAVELGSGIPQCWVGTMAQNPLAREWSWFHKSWKRRASRAMGGERKRSYRGIPGFPPALRPLQLQKAPDLQGLKQTTCLAYPARLRDASPDVRPEFWQ